MNILMIDNYDSFTYTLVHYLKMNKRNVNVIIKKPHELSNDIINNEDIIGVVVSSGTSHPKDHPFVIDFLKSIWKETPILGIGLGHQILWHMSGGEISDLKRPMHGVTDTLIHDSQYLFRDLPNNITMTRYHSLECSGRNHYFKIVGTAGDDIMAIRHKKYPIFGILYHPESILSEYGHEQICNFVDILLEENE